ncbi:hypothetical protein GCM10022397_16580 [Flavivirga jejuensis]
MSFSQEKKENGSVENGNTKVSIFTFYPNPVEDELFVLGTQKIKRIEIIDVLGKSVADYVFNKSIIKIGVSELKSGIYLIQVTNESGKLETKRLIVK